MLPLLAFDIITMLKIAVMIAATLALSNILFNQLFLTRALFLPTVCKQLKTPAQGLL